MKRLDYIDALRGWAIFSVVLGHFIKQLNDSYYFFQYRVFNFIYHITFHFNLYRTGQSSSAKFLPLIFFK